MQRSQKRKLKITFFVSVFFIVIFIYFSKQQNNNNKSANRKLNTSKHTGSNQYVSPQIQNKRKTLSDGPKVSKFNSSKKSEIKSKLQVANLKNKTQINRQKSKVFNYSKRFLQIDQDLDRYKVIKGMYYISNTKKNRSRYPAGLIQSDHILIKSQQKLDEASVLQNQDTNNYSLFNRTVKFKTQDEQGELLLEKLKNYQFSNLNELSMINYKYELRFSSPFDALAVYSQFREKEYVKWSSIDVVEFVKID